MSYSADPLSLVQVGIFDGLKNSAAVQTLVTNYRKNVVGFGDKESDPRRDRVDESDLPEIVQVLVGGAIQLGASSSHVGVQQTYDIQINSGAFNVAGAGGLNAIQFAVYCALVELQYGSALNDLEWAGSRFVGDVAVGSVNSSESNILENRGINGWTTILNVSVSMFLPRQAMLTYNISGEMP